MAHPLLHSAAMTKATSLAMAFLLVGCGNPKPAGQQNSSTSHPGAGGDGQQSAAAGGSSASAPFTCTGDAVESATIAIPGGAFTMGCNAAVDANCEADENPMRSVTLAPFEIEQTE